MAESRGTLSLPCPWNTTRYISYHSEHQEINLRTERTKLHIKNREMTASWKVGIMKG